MFRRYSPFGVLVQQSMQDFEGGFMRSVLYETITRRQPLSSINAGVSQRTVFQYPPKTVIANDALASEKHLNHDYSNVPKIPFRCKQVWVVYLFRR